MNSYDIILTDAYRVRYDLTDEIVFTDTGKSEVGSFDIYGNVIEEDDNDDDEDNAQDIFELTKDWLD